MYSVNHPMHCLSFLLALKAHLDVEVEVDVQDVVKKSTKNKLSQNEKDTKNKTKSIPSKISKTGVVGRRTEGLHLMTTLALTYAHMSRKTVLALEVRTLFTSIDMCTYHMFFHILLIQKENYNKIRIFIYFPIPLFSFFSDLRTASYLLFHTCRLTFHKNVLVLIAPSLTDLDLSFSYIAYTGAEVK